MIDIAGILFSSVMVLIIIVRAVQFDRVQPWFQTLPRKDDAGTSTRRPWQQRD
jgi:hypothetical protein